ncbi:cupin domain-containing protein [Sulfitobacter sp. D35]|uniref:cupin domain-containing protein n=1 Tax=Sulfitobacter sp. D35 TaxID=3083252 RepID=UPI00296E3419|nr:cupin domain-containing protein [Sulfitobacter sp. D35]MDW4498160.1 cupin domain-containing protein [Sulfitobacter sp. D35]
MKDTDFTGLQWLGVTYDIILSKEASGGTMSIVDSNSPAGSGPPMHIHHDADETFVMLTGSCDFVRGGERLRAGPGETVFIPRGTEHTFRVTDDGPSRHLVILTPGGFEGFFKAMSDGQYAIPDDMEDIGRIAGEHHLEFTGPPLEG